MKEIIYRVFLTMDSTFLIVIVYLLKISDKEYKDIMRYICNESIFNLIGDYQNLIVILLLIILIIMTKFLLFCSKFLDEDDIKSIVEIEQVNEVFLPTYLGYFFVALSIGNIKTLIWLYSIIFIFIFTSSSFYFNPLFIILRYNFYNIVTKNGVKIFLITRRKIKNIEKFSFEKVQRINNFTFIELEDKNE